jgi:hypothetical protein
MLAPSAISLANRFANVLIAANGSIEDFSHGVGQVKTEMELKMNRIDQKIDALKEEIKSYVSLLL